MIVVTGRSDAATTAEEIVLDVDALEGLSCASPDGAHFLTVPAAGFGGHDLLEVATLGLAGGREDTLLAVGRLDVRWLAIEAADIAFCAERDTVVRVGTVRRTMGVDQAGDGRLNLCLANEQDRELSNSIALHERCNGRNTQTYVDVNADDSYEVDAERGIERGQEIEIELNTDVSGYSDTLRQRRVDGTTCDGDSGKDWSEDFRKSHVE